MGDDREHKYIPVLKQQLAERRIDRREFLRSATLLGMSAAAAYAFVGKVSGGDFAAPAAAQDQAAEGRGDPHRHALPGPQEPAHL